MSALTVQLCRIVSPDRLPDRLLASGVLTNGENRSLGDQVVLAYLFEVMQPWLPSAKLLPSLATTLEGEFGKLNDPNGGNLDDRFELLLRAVNQTLNSVSEAGETDWIGNLNGLILAFSGEELHFAQTGRAPAYLLQNNRIRQITDDAGTPPDAHPLKTFANLASGQLNDGDQILIANQELYREISLDALRRILNTNSPFGGAQTVARELKRSKNASVSGLFLRFGTTAPAAPEAEMVMLEEEMQSGWKKLSNRLKPLGERAKKMGGKAVEVAGTASKQAKGVWEEKVAPKAAEILSKKPEEVPEEAPPAEPQTDRPVVEIIHSKKKGQQQHLEAIAAAAEARINQDEEEEFSSIIPESEFAAEEGKHVGPGPLHAAKHIGSKVGNKVLALLKPLLATLRTWLKVPRNRRIASLVAGVAILGITIAISISAARRPATPGTAAGNEAALAEARTLQKEITEAANRQDVTVVAARIDTLFTKLSSLKDPNSGQQEEAEKIWFDSETLADPLSKTTRFASSTATYEFSGEPRGTLAALPYFYAWNPNGSSLFRTGKGDPSETQQTLALPDTTDGIVSLTPANDGDTVGYALTKQSKVYRIDQIGTASSLHALTPTSGDFTVGDAIGAFAGNLYILDGKAGLLWRYPSAGSGQYGKGVSIIDINKYDIKKAVSLAIDGAIYILKSDGSVMKFTSGKEDTAFSLKNIPLISQKLVQPLQIITDETYSTVYVLDAGSTSSPWSLARVLEFSKSGDFIQQFALPKEFTKVRGFDVNPKDKKLWVLNDKTISEFDF